MKTDPRIWKSAERDSSARGWTVDLSEGSASNPDCYWEFRTLRTAVRFLTLVDAGMDAESAYRQATA